MTCKFNFLYYYTHKPGTQEELHKHHCYELVYYVDGNGTMGLNGELYSYSPNTITLTRPDHLHDEKHLTETEVIFIGFTYDDYPIALANGLYMDDGEGTIRRLLLQMKRELLDKKPYYNLQLNLLTEQIIIELDRSVKVVSDQPDIHKLLYARAFIDENYSRKLDLQAIARISGYSYDYFRRLFKRHIGLSPVQYLIHRRVDEAKLQLANTDKKLTFIAMDCGFSTTSQFSQMFKEIVGELPNAYRKKKIQGAAPDQTTF